MSFKQRLKSSYTMTRFDFSWKMIPESRSRDRKKTYHPRSVFKLVPLGVTCCWSADCVKEYRP